jgi:hypothetical protein
MARRLAAEEELLAGVSTGLNVVGAIDIAMELGEGHTVVTVAMDTGLKYLAGGFFTAYEHGSVSNAHTSTTMPHAPILTHAPSAPVGSRWRQRLVFVLR